jgi:hypothetical protein
MTLLVTPTITKPNPCLVTISSFITFHFIHSDNKSPIVSNAKLLTLMKPKRGNYTTYTSRTHG